MRAWGGRRPAIGIAVAMAAMTVLGAAGQLSRPPPPIPAVPLAGSSQLVPGAPPRVPWPAGGIAAIGAAELGVIDVSPGERPLPIASVAKVMTALVVLEDRPLGAGERGPMLQVTDADVAAYRSAKAEGQSAVEVRAGEQLSEYEALQGLLIPSGNNLAGILAAWDAGSLPNFVSRLNQRARTLGMHHTFFADASGFDERTVSTPSDLTRLAVAAMRSGVIAEIVGQPQAQLPVAGTVYNVNYDLGRGGVEGIKTGSTPAAGACFMFSGTARLAGRAVTVVGAVMALPTLDDAFAAAEQLIGFARANLIFDAALREGQAVARYSAPWGPEATLRSSAGVFLVEWPGMRIERRIRTGPAHAPVRTGSAAGAVEVRLGDQEVRVPLVATGAIAPPSLAWRLLRLA